MASTDAKPVPKKNVAYRVTFPIYTSTDTLQSAAAGLDSEVSKDGAAFADCTNETTEIGSTGVYYLDLTSDEMNADTVTVLVKTSTSGAKTPLITMYPEEAGDIRVDTTMISGDATAADNAELMFDGTGYAGGTTKLDVNAVALSGDSTAADNAESFFDGTGYAGTNNVIPTVTAVTNGVSLADDAITAAKFDESTAFPLKSADTGATAVARPGDEMTLTVAYESAKTAAQAGDDMGVTAAGAASVRSAFLLVDDVLSSPTTTTTSVELPSDHGNDEALVGCKLFHFNAAGTLIQARNITAWNNTTQVATVDRVWDVTPVNTDLIRVWAGALADDKTGYELSSAYDAAKTAAQAGDAMTLAADAIDATSLAATALAEIKAEVEAVLATTARAELSGVPAANASLADKLTWITMLLRNKRTQDDSTETLFADDATTEIATSDKDVTAGVMTRGEYTDVP